MHPLSDQKGLSKKGLACTEKCIVALHAYRLVSLTLMSAKTKINRDNNKQTGDAVEQLSILTVLSTPLQVENIKILLSINE